MIWDLVLCFLGKLTTRKARTPWGGWRLRGFIKTGVCPPFCDRLYHLTTSWQVSGYERWYV